MSFSIAPQLPDLTSPLPKVLFIDIDGVLHDPAKVSGLSASNWPADLACFAQQQGLFCFAPHLASVLQEHPEVMVIVHSNWREHVSNALLRQLLGPLAPFYEGVTGDGARHQRILNFVERMGGADYRIVDDDVTAFPDDCPELIACDPSRGVSDLDVLAQVAAWCRARP